MLAKRNYDSNTSTKIVSDINVRSQPSDNRSFAKFMKIAFPATRRPYGTKVREDARPNVFSLDYAAIESHGVTD